MPSVPTNATSLALLPVGDVRSNLVNDARNFVPRNPRVLESRPVAFLHHHVAVAKAACLYFDSDPVRFWLRNLPLDHLQIRPWFSYLNYPHDPYSPFTQISLLSLTSARVIKLLRDQNCIR